MSKPKNDGIGTPGPNWYPDPIFFSNKDPIVNSRTLISRKAGPRSTLNRFFCRSSDPDPDELPSGSATLPWKSVHPGFSMALILDGNSKIGAHVRSILFFCSA